MRPTSDPKTERIKLRLNDAMKSHVDKISAMKGITVSEYMRELIQRDMNEYNTTHGINN